MIEPYTVAITSCGRFDLLERTLASLIPVLEGPVEKIVIIEDSGLSAITEVVSKFNNVGGGNRFHIDTIINHEKLGQIKSIDRLYSHIETEWIFHCEDDWEFLRPGFIKKSFALMQEFDSCSMVSLLSPSAWSQDRFLPVALADCGVSYHVSNTTWKFVGMHFNPGLRRMRDYKIVGPYSQLGTNVGESFVARAYQAVGFRVLCLPQRYIRHIGEGRQVYAPERNPSRLTKVYRSAAKPFKRVYRHFVDPYADVKRRFEHQKKNLKRWQDWEKTSN